MQVGIEQNDDSYPPLDQGVTVERLDEDDALVDDGRLRVPLNWDVRYVPIVREFGHVPLPRWFCVRQAELVTDNAWRSVRILQHRS